MHPNPPASPVTIDGFTVTEVINPDELQRALASVNPYLEFCRVTTPSAMTPWMVLVGGAVALWDAPHYWETEVDMRGVKTAGDVLKLAGMILASIDQALAKLAKDAA